MRFTLAAGLALTAYFAVVCFLLTTQPSIVAYFLLLAISFFGPACAVAGIVYGRDNLRAFCVGAALPLAMLVWTSLPHLQRIRFEPEAYGWSSRASTPQPIMPIPGPPPAIETDPFGETPIAPTLSYDHQQTLREVMFMTHPTCSLSIAAILSGILVMAIRGGLKRKEPDASGNAGG